MRGSPPALLLFMWYTYILKSKKYNQLYIGSTNDLNQRLKEHNIGNELSTKRYRPWEILYYEAYRTEDLARIREKRLKYNGNAIRELKKRVGILSKSGAGFTLIEIIIYIAVFATILVSLTGFLWLIVFGNIKETSYQEVQQNGRFALTKMTQEIKKAIGINNPLPGGSDNILSLTMADPNLNPTIFDLLDGKLRITQGTNLPIELTSDQVRVSSLQFANLSYPDTSGIIRVELVIEYLNPSGRSEYQASVSFNSSISLVPGGAISPGPEIKKPRAYTDPTTWINPTQAYNFPDTPNDQSDYASDTRMPDANPAILFQNWAPKSPPPYTSLILKVNWRTSGGYTNDRFAIQYTTNGGGNWSALVPLAFHNETTIQTPSANLNSNQDLSQIQIKVVSDRVGPADPFGALFIYDIWTEGGF